MQHLHRNIISSGRRHHDGLDPDAELVRSKPFLVTLDCSTGDSSSGEISTEIAPKTLAGAP